MGALEPPHLVKTGWQIYQWFSEDDDPDRMMLPWTPPSFLKLKDPAEQSAKTSAEDIAIDWVDGASARSFAKVVHGVMDEQDCAELLACVSRKGFIPALLNT